MTLGNGLDWEGMSSDENTMREQESQIETLKGQVLQWQRHGTSMQQAGHALMLERDDSVKLLRELVETSDDVIPEGGSQEETEAWEAAIEAARSFLKAQARSVG